MVFFFTVTATTEIYTLSLHDALPIFGSSEKRIEPPSYFSLSFGSTPRQKTSAGDRKSTRLNSSHRCISYAVFCLKKKKKITPASLLQPRGGACGHQILAPP